VQSSLESLSRASEMLALNEILKRQRPDLRFVPLESLIGLVVKGPRRKVPLLLGKQIREQARVQRVDVEDLPVRALMGMLDMPPEDLGVPDVGLRDELKRRGFSLTVPVGEDVPRPSPFQAISPEEFKRRFGPREPVGKRLRLTACAAAGPFIGRGLFSPEPRIRIGSAVAALFCGISIGQVLAEVD